MSAALKRVERVLRCAESYGGYGGFILLADRLRLGDLREVVRLAKLATDADQRIRFAQRDAVLGLRGFTGMRDALRDVLAALSPPSPVSRKKRAGRR